MKKLLNLLRSERSLIGGAFGSLSDMFGWDRAVARIIGFLILWGIPYCFGASIRSAWWISILIYIGFALIVRKRICGSHFRDSSSAGRPRAQRCSQASNAPSREKEEPAISTMRPAASRTGTDSDLVGEQFGDALSDLEQRLVRLDRRIQRIESVVTDRSFDWDRRLRGRP